MPQPDSIPVVSQQSEPVTVTSVPNPEPVPVKVVTPEIKPIVTPDLNAEKKVSALSLASIRAKKELEAQQRANAPQHDELPTEAFTETDMLLQWNKFAQRLSDKGQKIMATYMQINDPVLDGTTIKLELPNEGSKVDFDNNKIELLGYLRGKLHNHDIVIEVHVNEIVETKYAFTALEKFEKLKAINPALDLLRKAFDLDV
ncbi:DNA polymerase III subunit gamma/tau [Flavobacterium cerinum]|uniref:DNA polymerase III subunit gamma/tau n=1 Tax=Flavobacterium cerinum TaxID=2502784 RepID=A0ABY5IQN6_9FLAO|nr:DNA polymerase III subunit gamma/tau [Flavobacterium cerinum]UUC44512.1 DNA polymerase III subunit gamma/tau [Flavobacterium cerinum]